MTKGVIGLEMYFIIEGEVEIYPPGFVIPVIKTVGQPIGEMAVIEEKPAVRAADCFAKSDVALAVLEKEAFRFVME